jgi:ribokinase
MENNNKITVLGSANYDYFLSVDRIPEVGETISARSLKTACGGKGANQAAAIGKLGHPVNFVSQIGSDSSGKTIFDELSSYSVELKYSKTVDNLSTGQAFIFSFPNHDNSIIIVGGANMEWSQNNLDTIKESLNECNNI